MSLESAYHLALATSQSFTVVSSPVEASHWPSGLNATSETSPVCPGNVRICRPVVVSHNLRVASFQVVEASHFPSGLNANDVTLEGACLRIAPRVPDLDRAIRAGRSELHPVGAEGDLRDRAGVALERERLQAALPRAGSLSLRCVVRHCSVALPVPDLDDSSQARTRRAGVPSGLKATLVTPLVWPVRVRRICPVATSQTCDGPLQAARGKSAAVGAEGHSRGPLLVAAPVFDRCKIASACRRVPDPHDRARRRPRPTISHRDCTRRC